jgi:hypothetical protein
MKPSDPDWLKNWPPGWTVAKVFWFAVFVSFAIFLMRWFSQ